MGRWETDQSQGSTKNEFIQFKITPEKPNIGRLLDPEGYIKYYESWINCDDNVKRRFIIGASTYDAKSQKEVWEWSPLKDIIGDPNNWYRGGLLESIKGEDKKQHFLLSDESEQAFIIVAKNGDVRGDSGGWFAKKKYAWEIIPRGNSCDVDTETGEAFNWSITNKAFKVLEAGQTLFDAIALLAKTHGELDGRDINFTRNNETDYKKIRYFAAIPDYDKFKHIVKQGPITPEEKAYTSVGLKARYAVASAEDILKYLEQTIGMLETHTGRQLLNPIRRLIGRGETMSSAAPEAKPVEKPAVNTQSSPAKDLADDSNLPFDTAIPAPAQVKAEEPKPFVGRAALKAAQAQAAPTSGVKVTCGIFKTEIDASVENCPSCGTVNLQPCDACGTPFSQWLTKCPNPDCGHEYK